MRKLFCLFVYYAVGQPISIPFEIADNGMSLVNISFPGLIGNETFYFTLKPKGSSCIMIEPADSGESDLVERTVSMPLTFANSIPEFSLLEDEMYVGTPRATRIDFSLISEASCREIAIGPGSKVLEDCGSVNYLRSINQLILYDVDGSIYRENCAPNSVVGIPFIASDIRADWVMMIDMGDWVPRPFRASTWMMNYDDILHVPLESLEMITDIIESDLREDRIILRCQNVRQRLPRIVLSILDISPPMDRVTGQLVLYPEDYTRMYPDGSCKLLIGTGVGTPNSARFNPLLVPGLNVRFTDTEIFVCDAV